LNWYLCYLNLGKCLLLVLVKSSKMKPQILATSYSYCATSGYLVSVYFCIPCPILCISIPICKSLSLLYRLTHWLEITKRGKRNCQTWKLRTPLLTTFNPARHQNQYKLKCGNISFLDSIPFLSLGIFCIRLSFVA
jgi:hypothetical protein